MIDSDIVPTEQFHSSPYNTKTMFITRLFFPALFLLVLVSCKEEKKSVSVYEGCCGAEATTDSIWVTTRHYDDQGNPFDSTILIDVFIPNLFTNDNDGENDQFMVFGNIFGIIEVVSMTCTGQDGSLLFKREHILLYDPKYGWDGTKPDGTVYQGSFNFEVTIAFVDGQVKTYTGQACAYQCGQAGFPTENLPDCLVPAQNNGYGGVDTTLPIYPADCFEH